MSNSSFPTQFQELTGHRPMPWQEHLYVKYFGRGSIPETIDLPTGLGKTSIMAVWLIALAHRPCAIPRRLVYVVNRRTVVDQSTDEATRLRANLPKCPGVVQALRQLAVMKSDVPLAVSTLRGELADNEEWKADPSRPAIIVGTIDMIGSKLLFSGYGDGRYHRAHHPGLIGQDTLIVHDEAHLTPAFSDTLRYVEVAQRQSREPRPMRVMELSATQRNARGSSNVLRLGVEDEKNEVVVERLDARKRLRLHPVNDENIIPKLVELAKAHAAESSKVLIYVHSPDDAQKVVEQLKKALKNGADDRLALLTGTIRGHERDCLVNRNPVYRALLDHTSTVERTVYLVSTSAGEVGIDLDADHMVCDVTTLDSMIQRLGRVNRRGGKGRDARVDVVWSERGEESDQRVNPVAKAVAATLKVLRSWRNQSGGEGVDVSPRNLGKLVDALQDHEREAAFSPKPVIPQLTDILLDGWSLTSIDTLPGRPVVAAYLHGLTADPPETYVVWRKELRLFKDLEPSPDSLSKEMFKKADAEFRGTLRDWFRACRIEPRERLRDRTDRVKKTLQGLLQAHRKHDANSDFTVVLLNERGQTEWSSLSIIVKKDFNLEYSTIVLPVEAGGLNAHGMLDGKALEPINNIDLAEQAAESGRRERWLRIVDAEGERYERLLTGVTAESLPVELCEREQVALREPVEGAEAESAGRSLLLMTSSISSALESPQKAAFCQTLSEHTYRITACAQRIADALWPHPTQEERHIAQAVVMAAQWHDRGKDRSVWQRYARNRKYPATTLAKSPKYLHSRALGGYRHELGSLLEALACDELRDHPERDLILHLIAAHHGHARPHVQLQAFDHERFSTAANEDAATEVMRRFGRLQQRFGRWGLAWLESLLRCADQLASQPPVEQNVAAAVEEIES